ncbi:hypothetical protein JQ557_27955 [Bradyrhizobium sp. U87765 SZCCT0131]|uniref:hypothetical protein n=1 Tax=unclassified Bradyrhizobium TaxID=2631580 RepID=UPI001BACBA4C|nr:MULTISPECIES: hypothetical protein [unclassified Bradyrhizobium]MBR1221866.1 hypothetical protein [Bradyrhizobium sp. U87765 SZCCT0131]MBR1263936.1 hypothetical protein [Bradyrhizobium sp. U87765 SZCCT0134]MBR1302494.1 hypothetical protein [Bradyrhizobium sp. U87765 SZCCT0110]MBR1320186.1 hypothetical protein [Bradyrhizobium sp. U87765 SZCCT0109]MBR1348701.1 hypothetical protein [Bradyrhizobium sp. U87765 SZCCT0048]
MPIMLRSTVGPFDDSFIQRVARIERSLIGHGVAPSQFTILKDRALAAPPSWDYTLLRGDDACRLTLPDDLAFMNHIDVCCRALDDAPATVFESDGDHLAARLMEWIELLATV